ncbi:Protein of unknown function [Cotesia congregata]|uniref:Uncharacterized protein n=1 Tax=Cotesia congregata TaxID=51543 RepID=A0A8J2H9A9_COTCN|nr:Protein of unknown function [Cotesia congregata]
MSKLGLFLFVFALFVCYISANSVGPIVTAGEPVRVEREASAQPDPGHRYQNHRGNGGYQHHYQHHYPSNYNNHGHGGWGGSRRGY